MAYESLRDWVEALERAGELKRVKAEVSPLLEMAEVADRAVKGNGPALLFENVAGYKGARVLMNQFGSERRMRMALDVDSLDDVAKRIEALLRAAPPAVRVQKNTVAQKFLEFRAWHAILLPVFGLNPPDWTEEKPAQAMLDLIAKSPKSEVVEDTESEDEEEDDAEEE